MPNKIIQLIKASELWNFLQKNQKKQVTCKNCNYVFNFKKKFNICLRCQRLHANSSPKQIVKKAEKRKYPPLHCGLCGDNLQGSKEEWPVAVCPKCNSAYLI